VVKSLSEFISSGNPALDVTKDELSVELIKDIQISLKIKVDGIIGNQTLEAFKAFKEANYLEFPYILGIKTAEELLEEKVKEDKKEEDDRTGELLFKVLSNAGQKTGKSVTLFNGQKVYENEFIVPGIPLTWGEGTKGLTRLPSTNTHLQNAKKTIKAWGEVREKFGSPLIISSAFRDVQSNKMVGGARNSQHLYFLALDMIPLNKDFNRLWEILKASQFTGLGDAVFMGRNKGFFHADMRAGDRIIFAY
jgi:hypothetical protein